MSRMNRRSFRPAAARMLAAGVLAAGLAVPATASAGVLDSVSGWWPMYEGSGQTVHDLSGKGNHGTLGSTPASMPTTRPGSRAGSSARRCASTATTSCGSRTRPRSSPTSSPSRPGFAAPARPAPTATSWARAPPAVTPAPTASLPPTTAACASTSPTRPARSARPARSSRARSGTASGTTSPARLTARPPSCSSTASSIAEPDRRQRSPIDYNMPTSGDASLGGFLGTCDLYLHGRHRRRGDLQPGAADRQVLVGAVAPVPQAAAVGSTPRPWRRLRRRHPTGREPSGAVCRASFTPDRSCLGDRGPGRGRASPARGRSRGSQAVPTASRAGPADLRAARLIGR